MESVDGLECHQAIEIGLACQIDDTHAAATYLAYDLVPADRQRLVVKQRLVVELVLVGAFSQRSAPVASILGRGYTSSCWSLRMSNSFGSPIG
ncbi:MAG: hypothetical protein ABR992_01710 [Solirubrobacteraceae bacterium]|jgi:hypothetical protein